MLKRYFGVNPQHTLVLTVARFLKFKGYHLLIKAIPLVIRKVKDIHFVFVGTGKRSWIEELIKALGLRNVRVLTNVPPTFYHRFTLLAIYMFSQA